MKTPSETRSSKSFTSSPVTFLNRPGSSCVITSFRHCSRKSVRYMKIGILVANLMSFSWISRRLVLYSFSSSDSSFFCFLVSSLPSRLAFFTASDLLMMVSMSSLRLLNPSILMRALIASSFARSLLSVSLSTLTRRALSQRRASSVADVPAIAISRMSAASTSRIALPSYARTGRKLMNSPTFFSGLSSFTESRQL